MATAYQCDGCLKLYVPYTVNHKTYEHGHRVQRQLNPDFFSFNDDGHRIEKHMCPDCLFDMAAEARRAHNDKRH